MTLVHRHVAKSKDQTITSDDTQDAQRSAFRTVTRLQAASIPILSISIPEPIATHNSYSMLNDTTSSNDSDKYTWNSHESSDSTESDTDYSDMPQLIDESIDYSDMPSLIESNDASNEQSDEQSNEQSNESESESERSESSDSDQEIVVNQQRYQRVRKSCKDHLPCPITCSFTLWAIAVCMQFIFHLCRITNDKCSRTL